MNEVYAYTPSRDEMRAGKLAPTHMLKGCGYQPQSPAAALMPELAYLQARCDLNTRLRFRVYEHVASTHIFM